MTTASEAAEALPAAEQELLEWATGKRSNLNIMMTTENWLPGATMPEQDRQKTLALTEQADAASIQGAIAKVQALHQLMGLTAQGADPAYLAQFGARS